ncbi:hypothetical protein JNB63_17305 [Microbacterium trichothecenolyticum]|uniref:hypothetical protein n=1 Tax=Microbacterium trichothecenolyticum TaxID=69370 RepID=UPI001C6ED05D|nr:hypothetical protein [Microbacterium trichothecenolyticum]MBW9121857.1 hypothetical protein [Microbacterium trichothecenolyticum]
MTVTITLVAPTGIDPVTFRFSVVADGFRLGRIGSDFRGITRIGILPGSASIGPDLWRSWVKYGQEWFP